MLTWTQARALYVPYFFYAIYKVTFCLTLRDLQMITSSSEEEVIKKILTTDQ